LGRPVAPQASNDAPLSENIPRFRIRPPPHRGFHASAQPQNNGLRGPGCRFVEAQRIVDGRGLTSGPVEQARNSVACDDEILGNEASSAGQSVANMQAARCPARGMSADD